MHTADDDLGVDRATLRRGGAALGIGQARSTGHGTARHQALQRGPGRPIPDPNPSVRAWAAPPAAASHRHVIASIQHNKGCATSGRWTKEPMEMALAARRRCNMDRRPHRPVVTANTILATITSGRRGVPTV
ncbi:hypothetical protein E2C01_076873 [Portunus trituberculatus]|uniref:Uncharacterized protein n=1 Tax=Portunus trituberculatus TaxID=210409 RepID=A0A5B7IPU6_PORTR|nr:hypothetical protein [Portunus trituberculatus]